MIKLIPIASLCALFAVASFSAVAQPVKQRLDELNAQKIAFITAQVDLTPAEAEAFWPVYNAYSAALREIRLDRVEGIRELRNSNNSPAATLDSRLQAISDECALEAEYDPKFRALLGDAKTLKLYRAESEFRQQMLNRIQERRGGMR